jgi:hypothetical protein
MPSGRIGICSIIQAGDQPLTKTIMGLDIYLYRYENHAAAVALEKEYEEKSEAIWETVAPDATYEQMTEAQKDNAHKQCAALCKKMKLNENGCVPAPDEESIELESTLYPKHLFKIGYFRSSYNEGGINHILRDRLGQDLYSVLGINQNESHQQPNWAVVVKNCVDVMQKLTDFVVDCPYTLVRVDPLDAQTDENAILEIAKKELKKNEQPISPLLSSMYSNRVGFFAPKGLTIYGVVLGKKYGPCAWLITKPTGEDDGLTWYIHALEIVKETAEWVLSQPDPEKYWLHVSG